MPGKMSKTISATLGAVYSAIFLLVLDTDESSLPLPPAGCLWGFPLGFLVMFMTLGENVAL